MTEFRSVEPATGRVVTELEPSSSEAVEAALAAVAARFASWSACPMEERADVLRKLAARLRASRAEHALLMAEEIGKPYPQGLAEIDKCAWACEHAAEHSVKWLAAEPAPTEALKSYVRWDPLGVVLAIMPWNFPFWQLFRFGASALMAGNTILLKHAPNAPRCAAAIDGLFRGAAQDLLLNVYVPVEQVPGLLGDPRVAGVTLTGSTRAGRAVAAAAGQHLKPSVLELGGSDAFLVLRDADLELAATTAAAARLQNNGQSCIAAKRFIVEAPIAPKFIERFRAALAQATVGDPKDPATTVGPLARADLRDALHEQVARSVADGAKCLLGGEPPDRPGFWYPPTLLVEVPRGSAAWSEETFGPVAAVSVVENEAEAIAVANNSRFGLGSTVFTGDRDRGERVASSLRAGAVFINSMVRSDPRLPFGGIGDSGWGRELGREGMRSFTNPKTVWVA
jgi:acyl-CoA reductase-like NAD-dependent aldehyde dehydrogenase